MKKILYIPTIIATTVLTSCLTISCTEDEEYYDSNMFTRAENMTRIDPEPGNGQPWINSGSEKHTESTAPQIDLIFDISWGANYTSVANASISYSGNDNRSSDLEYTDSLGIERTIKRYKYVNCQINRKFASYEDGCFVWNGIILYYQKANEPISGISDGTYGPIMQDLVNIRYKVPETYITNRLQ